MENNTALSLAPAAGQGLGKIVFDRLLAEPGFIDEMVAAARDGLRAMSPRRWDKEQNNGRGGWINDPDYRTRIQTLFGIFAQAEGDPIKRVIHELHRTGTDPVDTLHESPATMDALQRVLDKARYRGRDRKAPKHAETALEVE